ncbi:MAG: hypothetical protein C4B59_16085 [Candidatus Methanogaster sp.]|uniref:Uncharacterized protein n=1 Tax=Candidatus Methanogaster sp. TaxID=3386292 RepID=A0AC61KYK6_9EURY|nr:MAG: hypothetical protein C4B59_16085 [ANME-2 cluster archaeon]
MRGITITEDSGAFSVLRVLDPSAEVLFKYEVDPNRTVMLPPAVVEFVDLTQYAAISVSAIPIPIVNGTVPIGAAADKIKSESERTPASASVVDMSTGGSGMAAVPRRPLCARSQWFTDIIAILVCLSAVLISRRMRRDLSLETRTCMVSCRVS